MEQQNQSHYDESQIQVLELQPRLKEELLFSLSHFAGPRNEVSSTLTK